LKCDGTRAETRFRLSAKWTSPFNSVGGGGGGGVSSVDCWKASCAHQPAGFALLVQACVLQSCDAYWLPTPFASFHLASPPVRHRVPSHFKRSQPRTSATVDNVFLEGGGGKKLWIWFDGCLGFEPRAVGPVRPGVGSGWLKGKVLVRVEEIRTVPLILMTHWHSS
jgi:hypothetical protein